MSPEHSKLCIYVLVPFLTIHGVILLTMSATIVDRLLAFLVGLKYRHLVTLRGVRNIVVTFFGYVVHSLQLL